MRAIKKKSLKEGAVGVVYYKIPENTKLFSLGLAETLGQKRSPFSLVGSLERFCMKNVLNAEKVQIDLTGEPDATWTRLRTRLLDGGKAFRSQHGRPAVLVLDGVELLTKPERVEFLKELQIYAKEAAVDGSVMIVFVFR